MGTDIHWVLERRHPDGQWHAVASKSRSIEHRMKTSPFPAGLSEIDPGREIGRRDYQFFHLLSGAQLNDRDGPQIAQKDLPKDASAYAGENLNACREIHSRGHFLLGRLRAQIEKADPRIFILEDHEELIDLAQRRLEAIEQVLQNPTYSGEILFGSEYEDDRFHPAMARESNHARLRRETRFQELLPVADDTVRLLIGYDN